MADTKYSALTAATTPDGTEFFAVIQGGNPTKLTLTQVKDYVIQTYRSTADVTNATTTPSNVTGCVFSFAANSYYVVELFALCTSAATTTGYGFALDTSVAVTAVGLFFGHQLANTGTVTGGSSIADNTATGLSSGVPTAATNVPIMGQGLLQTGASAGTAQLTFRPEVAASATIKAGSVMRVMKVA